VTIPPSRPSCPNSPATPAPSRPGFPSTTVTSLGSICTGQPPGPARDPSAIRSSSPGENRLLNGLRWDSRIDPRQWQPLPTVYERAAAAGIAAVHVTQGRRFRGNRPDRGDHARRRIFRPADSMGRAWPRRRPRPLRENDPRRFVTVYHGGPRRQPGTRFGVGLGRPGNNQLAPPWDKLAEQLAGGALPSGTCMCVTADPRHGGRRGRGQVRRGPATRSCGPGWPLLGGEPRAPAICTRAGAPQRTCWPAWRETFSDRAWGAVQGRGDQGRLVRPGWTAAMTSRIGDVGGRPGRVPRHRRHQGRAAGSPRWTGHARLASPPSEQLVPALMYTAA